MTTLLSILLLIGYIGKKKKALEDEDGNVVLDENGKEVMEYEKNKKGLWRLISIIPFLMRVVFSTEFLCIVEGSAARA